MQLRRTLRRTLGAAGNHVEFHDTVEAAAASGPSDLFVIDQVVRQSLSADQLQGLGRGAGLIVIGDSLEREEVVAMLHAKGVDHLISDGDDPDDTELVVTSVKLLSKDIFGLEKYLSWGVKVTDLVVRNYEDKREAMAEVASYAKDVGARRPVIAKIESVVDELLMNALYDAPATRHPKGTLPPGGDPEQTREVPLEPRALLRWACDGRYFAVSVEDAFGALAKHSILEHLARARQDRGRPLASAPGDEPGAGGAGAGLGLYFILSSVTRFIANVTRGERTEVICMFDLKVAGRDAEACARSLHVFGS